MNIQLKFDFKQELKKSFENDNEVNRQNFDTRQLISELSEKFEALKLEVCQMKNKVNLLLININKLIK